MSNSIGIGSSTGRSTGIRNTITGIVLAIAVLSGVAADVGIFSNFGEGPFMHETIRGQTVKIYGQGVYRHMPAEVAIQGIAQDYVTLFAGIPLLLIALTGYRNGSVRLHFLLAGVLGYFFVTYLFYLAMGAFNELFLCYVALLALTFFGLYLTVRQLAISTRYRFSEKAPAVFAGWFLVINAVLIALLWLGVVVPPLLDGTIYPVELYHFTTLIVQGFDLGLLLPVCIVVGALLIKRKRAGYIYATVYLGFLSLLMLALTSKILFMAKEGVNVIPVIFIIPTITVIAILCTWLMIRNVEADEDANAGSDVFVPAHDF